MTSALDSRPLLREDLKITRREHRGNVQYVVKIPDEGKYLQFGEVEVGLMQLMDGERTAEDISDAAERTLGVRPPAGQIADFAQRLKRLGVVKRTPAEKHLMLMERLRSQRRVRARRRSQGSVLRLRFSIGDPDRLFDGIVARVPWLWSPAFVAASVALFAVYGIVVAVRWEEVWSGTASLYTLTGVGAGGLLVFWGIFLGIGAIHEVGHGLTTKYFGGEVHEIGAMLLYFSPALFCNTNDAWTFERRSHRLWVTFAGPWIELLIAAVAAVVWFFTEPGTWIHWVAFLTVLAGGISSVFTNFNPLLPLDGYYALSDWMEIPNLRRRSFEYLGWMARRWLLMADVPEPKVTPRERRTFLLYGGLALAYSVVIALVSLIWLIFILGRFMGPWIWAIVAIIAVRVAYSVSGRVRAAVGAATAGLRAASGRTRRLGWAAGVGIVVVGLPFVLPWTFRATGEFTVAADPRVPLRAEVPGILDGLHVRQGDTVRAGDPVADLWNPRLVAELTEQRGAYERLLLTRASAEARGNLAAAAAAAAAAREARTELDVLTARRERLTIRSPIDGVVTAYRLPERLGEWLEDGTILAEVAPIVGRRARVRVPLRRAGQLSPGQPAGLRLRARPGLEFRSTVATVAPAAEGGWVDLEIPFPSEGWQPAPGMTGIAKVAMWRGTVAEAVGRIVRQTLRIDLWL